MKSETATRARRQIDRKLAASNTKPIEARPRGGWIRAIRTSLGMTQEVLARRLDVTPPAVTKLERSEVRETISIGKLAEVAAALDCRLVYVLVPNSPSLESAVQAQARRAAVRSLGPVATTMDLEDQSLDSTQMADQVTRLATWLIAHNRAWRAE